MVDYIKDNFAIWAPYYNRSIGEGWTRFAERTVGIDDDGNVVYKNTEGAQIEDSGGSATDLYKYDNVFGGIIFGDTGVPVRISVDAWDSLSLWDNSDSYNFVAYNDTPQDNDVPYYDTGVWKIGDVGGTHNHDSLYVNVTGGDTMEGPLTVGTSGGISCTGSLVVYTGYIFADAGNIGINNDYAFIGYNNAQDDPVELIQVSDADAIDIGDSSYNMNLIPGPGSWIGYGSDLAAPFQDLDNWDNGYAAVWNVSNGRFEEVDPTTWAIPEWDRTLDADEIIYGYDGGADRALIQQTDGTPPTFNIGNTLDANTTHLRGGLVNITSYASSPNGDVSMVSTNDGIVLTAGTEMSLTAVDGVYIEAGAGSTIYLDSSVYMRGNPCLFYMQDSTTSNMLVMTLNATDQLLIGESGTALINLRGTPTRPQYNGNDLALLTDAGGGPGTDTDAIHLSEAEEFNEVSSVTPTTSDRILFEDATDSWNKKYNIIGNLPFSASGHDHDSEYYTEGEVDTLLGNYLPLAAGASYPLTGDLYVGAGNDVYCREYYYIYDDATYLRAIDGSTADGVIIGPSNALLTLQAVSWIQVKGDFRLAANTNEYSIRNNADTGNITFLESNSSDHCLIGDTSEQLHLQGSDIYVGTGIDFKMQGASSYYNMCRIVSEQRIFGDTSDESWFEGSPCKMYGLYGSGSSDPTSAAFASTAWGVYKNTSSGAVFLCYDDGGTLKGVELTSSLHVE